jgi:hypothetical protein
VREGAAAQRVGPQGPARFLESAAKEVRLRSPRLPKFLDEVILRNLHVGDSSVDISVRRDGENVSLSVLKTRGNIELSVLLS